MKKHSLALSIVACSLAGLVGCGAPSEGNGPKAVEAPAVGQNGRPPGPSSKTDTPEFEASSFCRTYACSRGESYPLKASPPFIEAGDLNTLYHAGGASLDVTTRGSQIRGLGIQFFNSQGDPAEPKYDVVAELLASTDESKPHTKTLSFIKQHARDKLCETCRVIPDGKKMRDGKYDVYVGYVGQTVVFLQRVD